MYFCKKIEDMEYSSFLNLEQFNEEARRELNIFLDFLTFKYKLKNENTQNGSKNSNFSAIQLDTRGFKFNREEANER